MNMYLWKLSHSLFSSQDQRQRPFKKLRKIKVKRLCFNSIDFLRCLLATANLIIHTYDLLSANKSKVVVFVRDAVHTHFVTLIVKWTIVGGWVKPLDDKRDKVGTIKSPKNLG